jgi:hypothetical protein
MAKRWGAIIARSGDGRAVIFGGTQADGESSVVLDTTHLWDARGAALQIEEISASGPAPRYCGCAAWDRERDVIVMAGGRNRDGPFTVAAETWELSLADRSYRLVPVATPPGVIGCAMAFAAGAIHLFGGLGERIGFDRNLYRYEPAVGWTAIADDGPTGRFDAAFETLPDGGRILLVGGAAAPEGMGFFSDVWIFDARSEEWRDLAAEAMPTGRRVPWLVLDAPGGGGAYVGFGLAGDGSALADLYHLSLDPARYRPLPALDVVPGRGFAPPLPAPDGIGALVHGYDGTGPLDDAWVLRRD